MSRILLLLLVFVSFPLVSAPSIHEPTEEALRRLDRNMSQLEQRIDTRDACDTGIRPFGPKLCYYRCEGGECCDEEQLNEAVDAMLEKEVNAYLNGQ